MGGGLDRFRNKFKWFFAEDLQWRTASQPQDSEATLPGISGGGSLLSVQLQCVRERGILSTVNSVNVRVRPAVFQ